jgi:hypothetical protein
MANGKRASSSGRPIPVRFDARRRRGRPTKFQASFVALGAKLCQEGATDAELAKAFDCDVTTLWRWRSAHPEFRNAIQMAKNVADARVERSLFQRACGYSFDTVKVMQHDGRPVVVDIVEQVPADVAAAFIWLKNRQPQHWRDRHEHVSLRVNAAATMTDDELLAIIRGPEPPGLPAPAVSGDQVCIEQTRPTSRPGTREGHNCDAPKKPK